MNTPRIAELLSPFFAEDQKLPETLLEHISIYIDILVRWNARMNLTAIRDPEQIITRHFGESLFAARHLFPNRSASEHLGPPQPQPGPAFEAGAQLDDGNDIGSQESSGRAALQGRNAAHQLKGSSAPLALADVGSGAGFPGIPIKLWAPELSLTLIESNHKKATFLREVARALTLTNINVQNNRAETLQPDMFDVVTLRAVEHFEEVLPAAAALLKRGGLLALLLGSAQASQARSILPDYAFKDPIPIPLSRSRVLLI